LVSEKELLTEQGQADYFETKNDWRPRTLRFVS
jgi:hypothetical protein